MASTSPNLPCLRDEVRRRRKELKLAYRTVVARIVYSLYQQECDEVEITLVSEDWLKRLEIGRPASLSATILNALLYALEYSDRERVSWLLRAGYSQLASDTAAHTDVADVINYVSYLLHRHPRAAALIASAIADGQAADLTDDELLDIVANSLNLVLQLRRRD